MDSNMRDLELNGQRRISSTNILPPIRSILNDVLPPPLVPNVANALTETTIPRQYATMYSNHPRLPLRQAINTTFRDGYASSSSSSADSPRDSDFGFPTPSSSRRSSSGAPESARQNRSSGSSTSDRAAKRSASSQRAGSSRRKTAGCTRPEPCDCKNHKKIQSEQDHRRDLAISLQIIEDFLENLGCQPPKAQTANNSLKSGLHWDKQQDMDIHLAHHMFFARFYLEYHIAQGTLEGAFAKLKEVAETGIQEHPDLTRISSSNSLMAAPNPTGDVDCPFAKDGVCTEHASKIFCRKYYRGEWFCKNLGLQQNFSRSTARPSTSSGGKGSANKRS